MPDGPVEPAPARAGGAPRRNDQGCPANPARSAPPGGGRFAALLMAMAICIVALALALHSWLSRPDWSVPKEVSSPAPTTMPAASNDPIDWVKNPLDGLGLDVLAKDPPDVIVPPGAVRASGFRRTVPDGAGDIITYVFPSSDLAGVESFYRACMAEKGFKLMRRGATMSGDGVALVFLRNRQEYVVSLRPADKGRQVRIVLVIGRPDERKP